MPETIKDIGEFGLIKRISAILGQHSNDVIVGIGDDAATVAPPAQNLIITTDTMIEDIHFKTGWCGPEAIAHKALASNVSDLAAKAANPRYGVITFGAPPETEVNWAERFYTRLARQAQAWGLEIIGGDTVKSPQIIISITLWGEQSATQPVLNKNARPGDQIYVTGTLGDAAAGLDILLNKQKTGGEFEYLLNRFHEPSPRHLEALELIKFATPTSMTDLSDGLARDLAKICEASQTGAEIERAQIPISSALQSLAGSDSVKYAIKGGEDYELLITLTPADAQAVLSQWKQTQWKQNCPFTCIGEITGAEQGITYQGLNEPINGFNHFS